MLSGINVMDKTIDGVSKPVYLEYGDTEYDTIEKVANITLKSSAGTETTLADIAKITYADNPNSIPKYDKKYRATITTYFNENATSNT